MIKRILVTIGCLIALGSSPVHAVYFPNGIDWANPSQSRFILSLYLNVLGRAPQQRESTSAGRFLGQDENSQTRLDLFKEMLGTNEYQQLFGQQDNLWRVFRAPDLNYNKGSGFWRYEAATARPAGFLGWRLSGSSSEAVAEAMASYYDTFCYQGTPCIDQPALAYKRGNSGFAKPQPVSHACADEAKLVSQFEWIAANGTTYPRGTDNTTICMGQHYYKAAGSVLQRYQCEPGYLNCQRDESRDIRGQRTGRDNNGKPTLFFNDSSRLVLTDLNPVASQTNNTDNPLQIEPIDAVQHGCADPRIASSTFRWQSSNGTSESKGVGANIICMDNFYYQIDGLALNRFDCAAGFRNCRANPAKNITAQQRKRIGNYAGLEFRNGTTLALVKQSNTTAQTNRTTTGTSAPAQTSQRRRAGQHECADTSLRVSQYRWTRKDGTTSWPEGIAGRFVCLDNSYYEIQGSTLRHHLCRANYQNCQANKRRDLIAVRNTTDSNGNAILIFANGDQLSLLSR